MANNVRIGVSVDDKATKPIRDIRDAWKRLQNDGAQGLIAGVAAAASAKAFNLAGQAIHKVTDFLGDSVKASIDEAAGIQRLTTSLQANVKGWDGNTSAIEATIKSREALAFSDDDLRNSLGSLVGATHDVNKAFDLQSLAMDLARFKGIDLQSASEQLIKVNAGQYRSLKELGIEIDANASREEALGRIHEITAGQAEAFGNTTAGAMEAANIAVQDLQEEIGEKLAPAIRDGANALREDFIPAIEAALPLLDHFGDAINILTLGGTKVQGLSDADKILFENEKKLIKSGVDLSDTHAKANVATAALTAVTNILKGTFGNAGKASDELTTSLNDTTAATKQEWDASAGAATAAETARNRLLGEADAAGSSAAALGLTSDEAHNLAGANDDLTATADSVAGTFAAYQSAAEGVATALALVAYQAAVARANLAAMGSAQTAAEQGITSRLRSVGETPGAGVSGALQHGFVTTQPFEQTFAPPTPFVYPKSRGGGGSSGADQAKKDAEALADALRTKLKAAYDVAKQAADRTFDATHAKNLQAIADAKDHAYAIAQGTYALKMQELEAQKAKLYEQANADAASLSADQQARNLRDLQEAADDAQRSLADAMAGGDPEQIKQAQRQVRDSGEQLSDFQRQMAIDAEKTSADSAAAKIDQQEQAAADELAAAQKAADDAAAQATENENKRYEAEKAAYDTSYQLLVSHLDDTKTLHSKVNTQILADYDKYLAKYEAKGKDIGKSLLKGLKTELQVALPTIGLATSTATEPGGGRHAALEANSAGAGAGGGDTATVSSGAPGAPPIQVTFIIQVEGSTTFDPSGQFAYQLSDALVPGMIRAFEQRNVKTDAGGADGHVHPTTA